MQNPEVGATGGQHRQGLGAELKIIQLNKVPIRRRGGPQAAVAATAPATFFRSGEEPRAPGTATGTRALTAFSHMINRLSGFS